MKRIITVTTLIMMFSAFAFADDPVVSTIAVTPETAEMEVGEDATFTAEAKDSEGTVLTVEFTWSVDGDIGTVDEDGEFTATAAGTGSVVASAGEISGSAAVTVTESQNGQGGQGEGGNGGDNGEGNGEGEGQEDDEEEDQPVEIFPKEAWALISETIQFEVEIAGADGNEDVVWSVDNTDIGTIDENGLFTAVAEGETFVVVTVGENSDQAEVTVYEEVPPEETGNMIRVQRRKEDGKVTQFGSPIFENGTITIGGIPHPFNYLNGMKLHFPEDSIEDDIVITVNIPKFAKVDNKKKEVTFDDDILTAVTFEVSVNGETISPFNFETPIEVTLPYKKGLLSNLGIDPEDIGMYYVGQEGELIREGISNVSLDEENGQITGYCAHFSDVALAPKSAVPTMVEENPSPADFSLGQNFPNPFNPTTTIMYNLNGSAHVKINIFNAVGQHIRTLVDGVKPAGAHSVIWNGTDDAGNLVTNGVYFYSMEAGSFTQTRKLVLVK